VGQEVRHQEPTPFRPQSPAEIADELIEQLAEVFYEVQDAITVDDLWAAFERRFGELADAA